MKEEKKKKMLEMRVESCRPLTRRLSHLRLRSEERLPSTEPGQFVEIATGARGVLLRRPISVNFCEPETGTLDLVVANVGPGSNKLCESRAGEIYNVIMPLGRGFTLEGVKRALIVGGGVGMAPLLYLGYELSKRGVECTFLQGARTAEELIQVEELSRYGRVLTATDDGSKGHSGFVHTHPEMRNGGYDRVYCCGPKPMMEAVANVCRATGTDCEVSLENMMACGLGACLCCVEKTKRGNVCVCTEGPVFNIKELEEKI